MRTTTKLMEVLVDTVVVIMQEDPRLMACKLAQILQIAPSTTHVLLTKKLLSGVCAQWIPHSLTEEQRAERVRISRLVLAKWKHENVYFNDEVTCDEFETTEYGSGKERVCFAEESIGSKILAEDNGDYILGSERHILHALLPSWPNCEYGLL